MRRPEPESGSTTPQLRSSSDEWACWLVWLPPGLNSGCLPECAVFWVVMAEVDETRPGWWGRFRSRHSGHPTGPIGRFFGRAMVKNTAIGNDRAIELLDLAEGSCVLDVGCGQGRTL
ncbi:MAG: hypothetical protein AAGA42_14635, partial [Actinomycetota bacterium]